jgi:hypothetical protein
MAQTQDDQVERRVGAEKASHQIPSQAGDSLVALPLCQHQGDPVIYRFPSGFTIELES